MNPHESFDPVQLIDRLDRAVGLGDVKHVTAQIKRELEDVARRTKIVLPDRFHHCCGDSYARRLLHRSPELGYTVVVMTWGPGQQTTLHDHAGIWCVECVIEGELEVTRYDLLEESQSGCRFNKVDQMRAGVGNAGCLIPPYEYHVLANALSDRKSMTVHVYGGEMEYCNLYVPRNEVWWDKRRKPLTYDH